MRRLIAILLAPLVLSACEELGIPDPEKRAAAALAEGRAIGSACRQAGRALEDCFALNPEAQKAAIFDGWRSMNDYMTENGIDIVKPTIEPKLPLAAAEPQSAAPPEEAADGADDGHAQTPLEKLRNRSQREAQDH